MDFDDIVRAAREQGFAVERTQSRHFRFVPPVVGKRIVVTGGTPSDKRALQNLLGDLRRQGLIYKR